MNETKICTKCSQKLLKDKDFYRCSGKLRSECKKCTVRRNVRYQRIMQSWRYRYGDDDARRAYMRDYYSKNRAKFANYRAVFKKRHPGYYKNYRLTGMKKGED